MTLLLCPSTRYLPYLGQLCNGPLRVMEELRARYLGGEQENSMQVMEYSKYRASSKRSTSEIAIASANDGEWFILKENHISRLQ